MLGYIPQDKIGEVHVWRDWLFQVGVFIKGQQTVTTIPSYTTALAPAAVAGTMYFDTTLGKFRACEVSGTWRTVTTV